MGLRPPSPFSWRTLALCPTAVFPPSLLFVGGRKAIAVEQKPWRRCLLPSVEPHRGGGGIFPKLKCVAGLNSEQRHPPPRRRALGVLICVDGVWSAGLTGGQHGVRTLHGRTDCVPTHAARWRRKDGLQRGKDTRPPTARPRINEDELVLHAKPWGVAVTVLSEESTFEAGRNAFAVWPRLVAVKRLSSFRPKGQERPGLAEAAGLLGRFMSTHLRGRWRGKDQPRVPQTVVGGGCVAWAPLQHKNGSFLHSFWNLHR